MDHDPQGDIRRLLKTFGIQADEAIMAYLDRNPGLDSLQLQITLTDLTEYVDASPGDPLQVIVEGQVYR